jgi:hypothetical protein
VVLPAGTGLFGSSDIKVDANAPGDLNQMRYTIIHLLNTVKDALSMINCYQNSMRRDDRSKCLQLRMPDRNFFAAIPFLGRLTTPSLADPRDQLGNLNITFTLPCGDNDPNWPHINGNNFNDILTGIEFVVE